jgi:hypothetical protein
MGGKGPVDCSMKELQRSVVKAQAYGMCSHIFQVLKKNLQLKTAAFTWLLISIAIWCPVLVNTK